MPRLHLPSILFIASVVLGTAWLIPNASLAAADACHNGGVEGGESCAFHMLQARAQNDEQRSCPPQRCQLEGCCPKTATDCIEDADQVLQIWQYILKAGKGSACTEYVRDFLPQSSGGGKTVTADDLCVNSNLVMSTQILINGDPGACKVTMGTPSALAPQLGCNTWAWFSDSTAILAFLKAVYQQPRFSTGAKILKNLTDFGAAINPAPTAKFPPRFARVRVFDRTLNSGVPELARPSTGVLVQGPSLNGNAYGGSRTVAPFSPLGQFAGPGRTWWKGSQFLMTECGFGMPKTGICEDTRAVLGKLSIKATQHLITENYMEITGCPWTRAAQAVPGFEEYGPQAGDKFNFALDTGVYSCTGGLRESWTCMICPKDSKCIAPDADAVMLGNFEGCGMEEAQRCYPVSWYGNPKGQFPSDGCSPEWLEDMYKWMANPRAHLHELARMESGRVTAIQAVNTLMFAFDSLFSGGHSGFKNQGGYVNTDQFGNPTCSTTGASSQAEVPPPGTQCGVGENLPCCRVNDVHGEYSVKFAGAGSINTEFITQNVRNPTKRFPCMTKIDICGPSGFGPTVKLGNGVSTVLECTR